MTVEQATSDTATRPTTRAGLFDFVLAEAQQRTQAGHYDAGEQTQITVYAAVDIAWAEIERAHAERDAAVDDVLSELDDEAPEREQRAAAAMVPVTPLLVEQHATRLLKYTSQAGMLRELYLIVIDAFCAGRGEERHVEERVAAYLNDLATVIEGMPLWPSEAVVFSQLAHTDARIDLDRILADRDLAVWLHAEADYDRTTLGVGVRRLLDEIDDMPCLHGECPGPVELSPRPRCSLCHTRMGLRKLLIEISATGLTKAFLAGREIR